MGPPVVAPDIDNFDDAEAGTYSIDRRIRETSFCGEQASQEGREESERRWRESHALAPSERSDSALEGVATSA